MSARLQHEQLRTLREQREDKRGFWWLILVPAGIILATATHLGAFFFGDNFGREQQKRIEAEKPVRANPAPTTGLAQWSCSPQERREYLNVCTKRLWEETRVPRKEG